MRGVVVLVLLSLSACAVGPRLVAPMRSVAFDAHFVDRTLRVDYHHMGHATRERFALDALYEQGPWAGSRKHLVAPLDNGRYAVALYDKATGALLFARAFDSIFGEYRSTTPAGQGVPRAFHESALVPMPKRPVRFALFARGRDRDLRQVFVQDVDPSASAVRRAPLDAGVRVVVAHESGPAHERVDLALVGEGYTAAEEDKFRRDVQRFTKALFTVEPFKSHKDRFNVRGVLKPSQDSGASAPSHGEHRNTAVGASFDSFGSERYILTEDNKALRAIAAHVPYDSLVIMVNHKRYGGGGIMNLYSTFTTDNQWSDYIFVHELGHAFGGLADEYYSSSTAYNDFYPKGVEPTEPNITADAKNPKWLDFVTPDTKRPTPWEKAEFDAFDTAYQKQRNAVNAQIASLKKRGAPAAELQAAEDGAEALSRENGRQVDAFLARSKFRGQVGTFQGAGYASVGLYRPMLECIMFNRGLRPFCQICARAIVRMIDHYSGR